MDDVALISAGDSYNAAVKTDGSLWVWGFTSGYGLGTPNNDAITPTKIMDGIKFPSVTQAPTLPAPDVPSSWATEQVNTAIAANLVPQSLQSKYTQATTRAEFCALAVALYENVKGEITERKTFTDTSDINVQKMAAVGVVSGTDTARNLFTPDANLTREQSATMLARLADAIGKPLPKQASAATDNQNRLSQE